MISERQVLGTVATERYATALVILQQLDVAADAHVSADAVGADVALAAHIEPVVIAQRAPLRQCQVLAQQDHRTTMRYPSMPSRLCDGLPSRSSRRLLADLLIGAASCQRVKLALLCLERLRPHIV